MQDDTLGSTISSEAKAYELLEELELGTPSAVREAREKISIPIVTKIEVRPADLCRRSALLIEGSTREVARQGVSAICGQPVEVGSVFHVAFDEAMLDLPAVLAICDRCVMLEPTAFAVHFQFTQPIDMPQADREPESRST